jgi:hypothetical protein
MAAAATGIAVIPLPKRPQADRRCPYLSRFSWPFPCSDAPAFDEASAMTGTVVNLSMGMPGG